MNDLKLIVLDNMKNIGNNVDNYLKDISNTDNSYIIDITRDRFNNGEGKVRINESIRDKDIFILSDISNYSITYKMYNMLVPMSPDEHFQDIKRVISALSGYAKRITVVMPLLYQSRQDKRKGRESLDCALALQELERLNVNHIITFDCHNINVSNAIPNLPFENFFAADIILEELKKNEDINDLLIISPDMGGEKRARYYADILKCNVGMFYKRRDLTKLVNGKNPIIEHSYMGESVKNKTVIVVDDMIASSTSMIETSEKLREKGAKKVFLISTFSLFTEGVDAFEKAYKNKIFDKLYTTNLNYIPDKYKNKGWIKVIDMSKRIADIINYIHREV